MIRCFLLFGGNGEVDVDLDRFHLFISPGCLGVLLLGGYPYLFEHTLAAR